MTQKYIEESKQIQQNATYSAEAHHLMALRYKSLSNWFQVFPSVVAAITSGLAAAGISPDLLWLTLASAVTAAVGNVLNPQQSYQGHLAAAKGFTVIKHDARFLHEAKSTSLSEAEFRLEVQHLHEKYNELVKIIPPTDPEFFKQAQKNVASGIHEPDKDTNGRIL